MILNTFGKGDKRELSKEEEDKLREKISKEVEELKKLGASEEIINDFLNRTEKIFKK
jgi:hypothetical protein